MMDLYQLDKQVRVTVYIYPLISNIWYHIHNFFASIVRQVTMKNILCLLVIIFFSLTNTDQILGAEEPDAVLDSNGDELRAGINYYAVPAVFGMGGGLTLASTGKKPCPLDVVQSRFPLENGLPLTFTPLDSEEDLIHESTDLTIKFSAATTCAQSTVWTLRYGDGKSIITTGGTEGNPGNETVSNWFKIEKNAAFYKFRYCPTVCNSCEVTCGDIGIDFKKGRRRLVLSDAPSHFVFQKASTPWALA